MKRNLSMLFITLTYPLSLTAVSAEKDLDNNTGKIQKLKVVNAADVKLSNKAEQEEPANSEDVPKTKPSRFVFNYSYDYDRKEGLISGTSRKDTTDTLFPNSSNNFAPQSLNTSQGKMRISYIAEDEKSIHTVIIPYIKNRMITQNSDAGVNNSFLTESSGFGDIEILTMTNLLKPKQKEDLYLGYSLVLPTGFIDEEADTPVQSNMPLPFEMQLGTGSFALEPKLNYFNGTDPFDFGLEIGSRFYLNRNDNGYKWGDYYYCNMWGKFHMTDWFAPKIGLDFSIIESIDGRDNRLTSTNDLSRDPGNTGGTYLDAIIGMTLFRKIEVGLSLPVYQDGKGTQLDKRWKLSLSTEI